MPNLDPSKGAKEFHPCSKPSISSFLPSFNLNLILLPSHSVFIKFSIFLDSSQDLGFVSLLSNLLSSPLPKQLPFLLVCLGRLSLHLLRPQGPQLWVVVVARQQCRTSVRLSQGSAEHHLSAEPQGLTGSADWSFKAERRARQNVGPSFLLS